MSVVVAVFAVHVAVLDLHRGGSADRRHCQGKTHGIPCHGMVAIEQDLVTLDLQHPEAARLPLVIPSLQVAANLHAGRKLALRDGLYQGFVAFAERIVRLQLDGRLKTWLLAFQRRFNLGKCVAITAMQVDHGLVAFTQRFAQQVRDFVAQRDRCVFFDFHAPSLSQPRQPQVDPDSIGAGPIEPATGIQMASRQKTSTPGPTRARDTGRIRSINLALQGGGSHGAFAWGVVDRLLEDGRLAIDGISGTSAGSMNAVAIAFGSLSGRDGARQALHDFWKAVSDAGERFNPLAPLGLPHPMLGDGPWQSLAGQWFSALTHALSPYQLNPLRVNPLREVLEQQIDFEKMNRDSKIRLFLSATNVRSGKGKVFGIDEPITADMVMASACLPQLFQAVEVDGEHYWDGGFMGNPVLYPLFYHTTSRDVLIVHIDPIARDKVPTSAEEILDRVNEITFNASLIKELRAVHFVQKLMGEGWIKDAYLKQLRFVLMHSIRADAVLVDLSVHTKMRSDWAFLTMLRDRGRASADDWLEMNFQHLGKRPSVDLKAEFLWRSLPPPACRPGAAARQAGCPGGQAVAAAAASASATCSSANPGQCRDRWQVPGYTLPVFAGVGADPQATGGGRHRKGLPIRRQFQAVAVDKVVGIVLR